MLQGNFLYIEGKKRCRFILRKAPFIRVSDKRECVAMKRCALYLERVKHAVFLQYIGQARGRDLREYRGVMRRQLTGDCAVAYMQSGIWVALHDYGSFRPNIRASHP